MYSCAGICVGVAGNEWGGLQLEQVGKKKTFQSSKLHSRK